MWACSICQRVSVSFMSCFVCRFPLGCAAISLTLPSSPEMPPSHWVRCCWRWLTRVSVCSLLQWLLQQVCLPLVPPPHPLPVPLSLQYGSHSIVLAAPPDSPAGAPLSPSHPIDILCHRDTRHPRAPTRWRRGFSVSFISGLCSLLQTTAILFLPAPSFCSPLLHSNQIVKPSLKCLPAPLSRRRCIWPPLILPSFYPDTFLHSSVKHIYRCVFMDCYGGCRSYLTAHYIYQSKQKHALLVEMHWIKIPCMAGKTIIRYLLKLK